MKNVLVLHGPNLNLLGERPGEDPSVTLDTVNHRLQERAAALGVELRIFQSNHEGELIDRLHAERRWAEGVVISPDALAHTSYVLREAIAAVGKPTIEVHLSDIRRRESWRRKSVLKDVCAAHLVGKGVDSYLLALDQLVGGVSAKGRKRAVAKPKSAAATAKTIGGASSRKETPRAPSPATKTIGNVRKEQPAAKEIEVAVPRTGRATDFLTRALVRQKISERLSGKLTPVALASWARLQWNKVQEGAPAEAGHRDMLEDTLQTLTLSTMAASRLSDEQLVDLMAQLEG